MFSVVIPLFNKELSIKSTIDSVLNQSGEFEVIVINDGSTDDSAKKVREFKDPRIRLINQKNQGVSAARNRGVREAKYEWIAFIDADDLWKENHLKEIKLMMEEFPDAKIFSTSFSRSDGREFIGDMSKPSIYKIENFFSDFLKFKNLVITISIVLHRSCMTTLGGFDESLALGEDMDLWARLSKKYDIIKSNRVTTFYRINAENRSDKGRYNMERSFLSKIDFELMSSHEEAEFYKFWMIHKMKAFIVTKDWFNLLCLMRKYISGWWVLTNKKVIRNFR